MYYVYMLRCIDGSLYTGTAKNITKRLKEHFGNSDKKAKYTKSHKPDILEAVWSCKGKSEALKAEYRIKELKKSEKEELIKTNSAPLSICIKLMGIELSRLDIDEINYRD